MPTSQLQSILASELKTTSLTYGLYQKAARNWRLAEAENQSLREQLKQRSLIRKIWNLFRDPK
ncbi:MAG: hypothetical protein AAFN77_02945 [Planctomycetota bacterium]